MDFRIVLRVVCALMLVVSAIPASSSDWSKKTESETKDSLRVDLSKKVLNLSPEFHWIGDHDHFWFKKQTLRGNEIVMVDAATGRQARLLSPPEIPNAPHPALSPDGRSLLVQKEHDLWLRDVTSRAERRLTHDGVADYSYGSPQPSRREAEGPSQPLRAHWSPNSRFVVALRQDMRPYPQRIAVANYVPEDGGYATTAFGKFATARDEKTPDSRVVVIDAKDSVVSATALDPQALNDFAIHYFVNGIMWWSADAQKLFLITANRGGARYTLQSVDLATGETREIIEETARFNVRLNASDYSRPNVFVTSTGKEAIWYSERSGYGHLYLYKVETGKLKHAITRGEWVVFNLLRVDEARRLAYFTGGPRNGKGNPGFSYFYRVSLDGREPQLLTPEIADHDFSNGSVFSRLSSSTASSLSPSARFFVDTYSTIDQPPKTVIRKTNGELVSEVLTTDISPLRASGWTPPEPIVAKAADRVTHLYGVMFKPRDFDPRRKYAVIDDMYPGPQAGPFAPTAFVGGLDRRQTLADEGFIVIAIDGRGTGSRSRAFREAFLGTEDPFGVADHVAAIKDLAKQYSFIDLDRVGVTGQSFGGYGSLRAMLLYPNFFKVAISATVPADWYSFVSGISNERFFGVPSDRSDARAHYDLSSNVLLASRLKGRLLLIYGAMDTTVPLKQAFLLQDALIKANKNFNLLILPNAGHGAPGDPYAQKRAVEYFKQHL